MSANNPKISFVKPKPTLEVPSGTNLMKVLMDNEIPVASSCRGDGVCAKCRVKVLGGEKNLSPETEIEAMRREQYNFEKNERLSCQAQVQGDILIDTTYW